MERYYTAEEIEKGIEELPKISKTTLRNLRAARKIKYTKLGNRCVYLKSWILDYLMRNEVDIAQKTA
jgi:hypothetical protein